MNASLTPEQRYVLGSTYHFIESAVIYIRAVLPVTSGTDEQLLTGLVELAEMCLKRLPMYFEELRPLEEERKKREGV